eukprot:TRINITY_DN11134_c1_g1_i1.p1 TRINITY_DN11134_c1_g1~~TRINITY_DN11134_c1_g1_i1.p1  ORF type:complete len:134 (-),score=57.77 TRINITY_DN11134_c1_g1_i1:122-523(-)
MDLIPLIETAKRGNEEQMGELLSQGAKVGQIDAIGNTALHWAASGGHLAAVNLLIQHKADVNAKNKNDDTPLHKASWRNHADVCEVLLDAGCNRDTVNKEGKSALDLSRSKDVRKVLVPPVEFEEFDEDSGDE